jgi:hypothetical protein
MIHDLGREPSDENPCNHACLSPEDSLVVLKISHLDFNLKGWFWSMKVKPYRLPAAGLSIHLA